MDENEVPPTVPPVDLDHLSGGRVVTIKGPLGKVVLALMVALGLAVGVVLVVLSWL